MSVQTIVELIAGNPAPFIMRMIGNGVMYGYKNRSKIKKMLGGCCVCCKIKRNKQKCIVCKKKACSDCFNYYKGYVYCTDCRYYSKQEANAYNAVQITLRVLCTICDDYKIVRTCMEKYTGVKMEEIVKVTEYYRFWTDTYKMDERTLNKVSTDCKKMIPHYDVISKIFLQYCKDQQLTPFSNLLPFPNCYYGLCDHE